MEEVAEWRMVYISTMIYIIQYDSCLNQKSGSHLVGKVIVPWRVLGGSSHLVKWLGSPPFTRHEKAIWKGSHNPILRGLTNHGYILTSY